MLATRLNVKTLTLYLDDGAGLIIQGIGLRQNPDDPAFRRDG
jgi:hypothetical protein